MGQNLKTEINECHRWTEIHSKGDGSVFKKTHLTPVAQRLVGLASSAFGDTLSITLTSPGYGTSRRKRCCIFAQESP